MKQKKIIITKEYIIELLRELLTDVRLKKLGNFKKIAEMLGMDGNYAAAHPKI